MTPKSQSVKHTVYIHMATFVLVALIFLAQWLVLFSPHVPEWDAAYYYAFARSFVFDQDLNLENDLMTAYPYVGPHFQASRLDRMEQQRTITGRVDAPFAIGSSLLWAGWLAGVRFLMPWLLDPATAITGYEGPFIVTIAIVSTVYGWLAFWLGYRLAQPVVGRTLAAAAAITLMFTTPLLFYQFRDPIYSHTASALTTGLVVYVWWHWRERPYTWSRGALLGALVGLATLVRWQHLMYLALPTIAAAWHWLTLLPEQRRQTVKPLLLYGVAMGAAALIVFTPQMYVWRLFYGSWVAIPQGNDFVVWTAPFWWPTLFSTYRGLFLWMPVALFSFIGLVELTRQKPRTFGPLLLVLLLEFYVNSSTRDWFGGGGFGPRRFTSELVILLLGYAGFLHLISRGLGRWRYSQWGTALTTLGLGLILAVQEWILLRYGLAEKIGGTNLSMQPDFRWQETSFTTFVHQISQHLGDIRQHLSDFIILPRSPMYVWLQTGAFPWSQVIILLAVGLTAAAVWFILQWAIRYFAR